MDDWIILQNIFEKRNLYYLKIVEIVNSHSKKQEKLSSNIIDN
jgi:hypothetical protein